MDHASATANRARTQGDARAQGVSRRSLKQARDTDASRRTVLIALAANAAIAVAKLGGGLLSGSAAMFAEAAHSLADTTNQGFLLISIKLGRREPTPERPFGFGQERYLWTFVAAVGMFLAGALFAIGFGSVQLATGGGETEGFVVAYVVLAISFVSEGTSWRRALRQTRGEAHEAKKPLLQYVRGSRDPSVKMVLFEDSAALVGIAVATLGIALNELTGRTVFDPAASVVIGCLLVSVAFWMGRDAKHLLIGSAALLEERAAIQRAIEEYDEVAAVKELLTLVLGERAAGGRPHRPSRRHRGRSGRAGLDGDRRPASRGRPGRHGGLSRRHARGRARVGGSRRRGSRSACPKSPKRQCDRRERAHGGVARTLRLSSRNRP